MITWIETRYGGGLERIVGIDHDEAVRIVELRHEAGEAGDLEQVGICESALLGLASARAECVRIEADTAAKQEG